MSIVKKQRVSYRRFVPFKRPLYVLWWVTPVPFRRPIQQRLDKPKSWCALCVEQNVHYGWLRIPTL